MKELTKAEEQVMQYIWKLKKSFLKDILDEFPEPKPASTTVSTVIRVLVKKGFVSFNTYGKINQYYALVSKKDYLNKHFKVVVKNYFGNSLTKFANFFTSENNLSLTELEELKQIVEQKINDKKND